MLEDYARDVEQLPGISRTNPHAFGEAKGELAHKMRSRAKDLRTPKISVIKAAVTSIRPGVRTIGHREVRVESRRRA